MSDPVSLDKSCTFWWLRLASQLQDNFNHELTVLDITWPQWLLINLVARGEAATPAELAELIQVDRSAITRLVDRLVRKGLVIRQPQEHDKRSVAIVLSPAGGKVIDHLEELVVGFEEKVDALLTAEFGADIVNRIRGICGQLTRP